MPQLTCARCGVRYGEGAIVREPTLVAGAACRRCGGTLEPHDPPARAERDDPVIAVRSALDTRDGVPFA